MPKPLCHGASGPSLPDGPLSEYEDDQDPRNAWVLNDDPRPDGKLPPAKVVERIFTYLANGWRTHSDASAVKLMDQLNAEGIPTPSQVKRRRGCSTSWNVPTITSIVHNESYKGTRPQNRWREDTTNARARRAAGLKTARELTERPKSEWKWVDVPPIVDEATWKDANKQLARNRTNNHRTPTRYTTADVLLYGGIVRCAYCHYSMTPTHYTESSPNWYYLCTKGTRPAGRECSGDYPRILASEVDRRVWSEACRIIRDKAYLRSLLDKTDEGPDLDAEITYRAAEIAKLDADNRNTFEESRAWGGEPEYATLRRMAQEAIVRNAELRRGHEAKRDAAVAEKERRASREARILTFAAWAAEHADSLDDLTPEQRRQILLDMHPTVRIACPDDSGGFDRGAIVFALSDVAVTHALPEAMQSPTLWRDQHGQLWVTYAYPGLPTSPDEVFNGIPEGYYEAGAGEHVVPGNWADDATDVIDCADPT